jgi:adenylate cyclase, class 2
MSSNHQELEVKFLVPNLEAPRATLQTLGAALVQPRVHEGNLRFDNPQGDLLRLRQVLRLRRDTESRLTFKDSGQVRDGIHQRQELEFTVSDFDTARDFLEALGYRVVWMYEKYRQVYALDPAVVTLDEMPFGLFIEIEGPDGAHIHAAALQLGLDWEARILEGYAALFERARLRLGFTFRDLSFANFADLQLAPEDLGARWGFLHPG